MNAPAARLLVRGARVVHPDAVVERGWLAVEGGRIAAPGPGEPEPALAERYGPDEVVDVGGATVLPGFVDVHVHGGVGHEVMDATVDGLAEMSAFFARHGVTSFLATTWSAGRTETLAALDAVAAATARRLPGAQLLGAHMEGPYLSLARCGAQDPRHVRPPDLDEARRFFDTGPVRLMTLAPELARAQTHTFNAMPPLHHRAPGPAGAAIMLPELLAEIIADNHHVHPALLRTLLRAKGDAGAGADHRPAGRNAAGVEQQKGLLAPGFDADLVVLDAAGTVRLTVVAGRIVHFAGDQSRA